jgi:flagellar hook-basal body complex protein FliE
MSIPTAAATNAYAALARMGTDTASIANGLGGLGAALGAGLGSPQGSGPNFSAVLKNVIDNVSEAAHKSDLQAQAVANGKANMVDVVTAVAETETAVQTMVSVRDKVIAAYEDILKMQI